MRLAWINLYECKSKDFISAILPFSASRNNAATVVCRKTWLMWIKLKNADLKLFISCLLDSWSTLSLFIYCLWHCWGFCCCTKAWRQKWRNVYYSPLFLFLSSLKLLFLTPFPVEPWACDVLALSTSLLPLSLCLFLPPSLVLSPAWRRCTLISMQAPGGRTLYLCRAVHTDQYIALSHKIRLKAINQL